ncbi:hypothetical protein ACKVMT_00540 [Halobacteriales archaeon Cl-PHB]
MARTRDIDYPTWTKGGFLLGLGLFLAGALGEAVGPAVFGPLPGWEQTLLLDLEIVGVLVGLLAPLVFGIVLPLTE